MSSEQIIHFLSDGHQLTGTLHRPETPHPAVIIGCHGLLANRNSPKQIALAQALNRIGMAYFRFDHRGCGDSQGTLEAATLLSSRCRDLYHAIDLMQSHSDMGPVTGLFGASFGGTVVIATAAEFPLPVLITHAAPVHSQSIRAAVVSEIQQGNAIHSSSPSDFSFDIRPHLSGLKNILVTHGEKDEIVPLDHARQIYGQALDPKRLIVYENCDHRMSNAEHQGLFTASCVRWIQERLKNAQ